MTENGGLLASHGRFREFICGGGAASVNIIVTFPPNKLMFRQQLYGISVKKAFLTMKDEGWGMLYRGVLPPLLQATVSKSIMFGMYNWYDHRITAMFGNVSGSHHCAALLAGTTEAILTPFERSQTLLQIPKYNREFGSALECFMSISKFGIKEHFRGFSAIIARNGPSNMFFFALRQPLRDVIPQSDTRSARILADFTSGALLGAFLSTAFFPINVAKTRMQSSLGGPYNGVWSSIKDIYIERGRNVRHLYLGVHLNFTRSLLSWGILNATYEILLEHL